jgi:hypothetical protein
MSTGATIGLIIAAVIIIVVTIATQGTVLTETANARANAYASAIPLFDLIARFWPVIFALIPLTLAAATSGVLSSAVDRLRG